MNEDAAVNDYELLIERLDGALNVLDAIGGLDDDDLGELLDEAEQALLRMRRLAWDRAD